MITDLKNKSAGFWVAVATVLVAVVLIVAYPVMYGGTDEYSAFTFVFPLVGAVGAVVLAVFKKDEWMSLCLLVGLLAGFGFYVYTIYYYVSVVIVGIDAQNFDFRFIFTMTVFAAGIVAATVGVFLPTKQRRAKQ